MSDNITIELGSPIFELTPAKPRRFLEKALKRGLTVRVHGNTTATSGLGYTIESSNPIDDWQLWLHFQPGARGGRLTITRYTPSRVRHTTTKLTQMQADIAIDDMGGALDRHHARQLKEASADTEQAQQALAALKANGRFALRAAHRGTIPRNVPTKVRHALVRRGLVGIAGGALTDLGRAVRALIVAL